MSPETAQAYWRENITTILKLLVVHGLLSLSDVEFYSLMNLMLFTISGVKLGFWFAQQGAIYVFVILIFV